MTDHSSSADGVGEGRPAGHPAQSGAAGQVDWQSAQAQAQSGAAQQGQQAPGPYGYPAAPQLSAEAARNQVAAAWVRVAPQSANVPPGQAAVPSLPPRADQPAAESKKDKREQAKADRKAEYERKKAVRKAEYESKKAARENRKGGGGTASVVASASPVAAAANASASDAAPAPARSGAKGPDAKFEVPRPGGRLPANGRSIHVALRATLLITTCAFALGSCGVMGLVMGRSSVSVKPAALDSQDLSRYRLTDFPIQTAAVFAEEYAALCMTYSPETTDKRRESLARYISAGVDRDCGWNGRGKQEVKLASWDGTAEPLPEYGKNGRYLNVQVTYTSGRTTTLSVPVYVKDLAGGSGLRIAGNVGEMPLPIRDAAPELEKSEEIVDQELSTQLREQVLAGYFKAWAASDITALTRFTTPDATPAAVSGLAGALTTPVVQEVQALAPEGTEAGDKITYTQGQSVPARVTVVWGGGGADDAKTAVTLKRSYRVTVVNTAQGWFIKDIRGGVMDPTGGRADAPNTPSPSASQAPGASGSPAPANSSSPAPANSSSPKPSGSPSASAPGATPAS
ncbi:conjugal transfer protein [Streptomyces sp. NBC_01565]|uniref:conjugal transfer protein n=1 Tax=unclassified Streptomyces TaxID=2593676 RepID=UPI002250FF17|nr:conjugal transfer protein [Streptomyces sp. NBC_01565]MCX4542410.1 conjugal transfer protein [Streptomyces sp. NBC_01565]